MIHGQRAPLPSSAIPLCLALLAGCAGDGQPAGDEPGAADLSPHGLPPGAARPADVAPCYSPLATGLPATTGFWTTFGADDRAGRPAATGALRAAAQAHPKEEQLAVLLGLAQLWHLADPTDAEARDGAGMVLTALGAKAELERARTLCPSDHRLGAWLGPIMVAMGRSLNDPEMVTSGLQVLDEDIARYPAFVLFSRLLVFADRPRTDPDFQRALQAVRDNVSACGDLATATDPACINSAAAVHNLEGGTLFLGDVLAKAGLRDEALRTYQAGQRGPGRAAWPFRQVLADRIATLDARVAAYAAGDPAPGGALEAAWAAPYQCAICHKR